MLEKTSLQNGLRIISDHMAEARTVALGFWIAAGAGDEQNGEEGAAHLIEHMAFKGTKKRTAAELAIRIDAMGGQMNAYTAAEYTAFCVCILDRHLEEAFALLSEMLFSSLWDEQEIEKEKAVILQEYDMYEDAPEELIQDLYYQKIWPGHPLGRNILGSRESIAAFDRETLLRFHAKHYHAKQLLITAAGACDQAALVRLSEKYLRHIPAGEARSAVLAPPTFTVVNEQIVKKLEQVQIIVGTDGFSHTDKRWFAAQLLNTIVGGSVSSRLFQTVREEMGLTYSIGSGLTCFHGCGLFQVTAASGPQQADVVIAAVEKLLRQVCDDGVQADELQRAKEQVISGLLMGLESSMGRMNRAAKIELHGLPMWSVEQFVTKIETMPLAEVNDAAKELFSRPFSILTLGPKKKGRKKP